MSSSYYLKLYKEEKDKAKKYEKWIKQLQTIRQNAAGGLDDEIRNVNREITELCNDLKNAVKHDQVFASEVYEIGSNTEAGSGSDRYLRGTQSELMRKSEISLEKRMTQSATVLNIIIDMSKRNDVKRKKQSRR